LDFRNDRKNLKIAVREFAGASFTVPYVNLFRQTASNLILSKNIFSKNVLLRDSKRKGWNDAVKNLLHHSQLIDFQ
jgi:hypothetical protein